MLMPDSPLEPEQMLALSYAFDAACRDLGIGEGSLDVAKREKLARVVLGFVRKGETDKHEICNTGRSPLSDLEFLRSSRVHVPG